eukprot:m.303288 g.303288  ORF g.303288 m.303288 type:complete len:110 (+) comp27299_c0_seq6:2249-2578(+)
MPARRGRRGDELTVGLKDASRALISDLTASSIRDATEYGPRGKDFDTSRLTWKIHEGDDRPKVGDTPTVEEIRPKFSMVGWPPKTTAIGGLPNITYEPRKPVGYFGTML